MCGIYTPQFVDVYLFSSFFIKKSLIINFKKLKIFTNFYLNFTNFSNFTKFSDFTEFLNFSKLLIVFLMFTPEWLGNIKNSYQKPF